MQIDTIVVTLIFGVLPAITLFYLHKLSTKKLDTLIKLAELGGSIDPDMMKMLNSGNSGSYKSDYKWGLIWLAIGIPTAIAILAVPDADGSAAALIPMFIGIAYLISGKLRLREPDKT